MASSAPPIQANAPPPPGRSRALLLLYRLLLTLLTPVLLLGLLLRAVQGKEDPRRLGERLGLSRRRRPPGPLIWLHGASVGELTSLVPLLQALRHQARQQGLRPPVLLVTSVSRSSAERAPALLPPGVIHQLVPIDHWLAMALFRRHWRPDLGLLAEAELWPELLQAMPRLTLINARVSERSYRRHRRVPWFSRWLYGRCHLCFAQSAADAERLRRLGAPPASGLGSTKWDAPPPAVDPRCLARLRQLWPDRRVLLLASSHPGEEEQALQVWPELCRRLAPQWPALLLVPRHPHRARAVLERARAHGLEAGLWSQWREGLGAAADRSAAAAPPLLVVDALGLLGSCIAAADVVVMGGSLLAGGRVVGGHNPLEPVRGGRPVLCGPDMANFSDLCELLERQGWLRRPGVAERVWAEAGDWLVQPPPPPLPLSLQGPSAAIAAAVMARLPAPRFPSR
jgi:3-deoxy-D-manno-octulosonic-acid transferase